MAKTKRLRIGYSIWLQHKLNHTLANISGMVIGHGAAFYQISCLNTTLALCFLSNNENCVNSLPLQDLQ